MDMACIIALTGFIKPFVLLFITSACPPFYVHDYVAHTLAQHDEHVRASYAKHKHKHMSIVCV